ncbi:hypothetical protein B296_00047763 [Ensete ventricosum]|uniref:Uncharacterized protein n=1 Tax=Ensete ventricosum TaxID=4639 RepID=A0A426Y2M8_ENSVE|nr:hypothetical protein B296_00047763 [Ensete ventricosum]
MREIRATASRCRLRREEIRHGKEKMKAHHGRNPKILYSGEGKKSVIVETPRWRRKEICHNGEKMKACYGGNLKIHYDREEKKSATVGTPKFAIIEKGRDPPR